MGVIDTATYTLSCDCGCEERIHVVQKGSAYGAGEWSTEKSSPGFEVEWSVSSGFDVPNVKSAKCRKCGRSSGVTVS